MTHTLSIGGIMVKVLSRQNIKSLKLSVRESDGRVLVSTPPGKELEAVKWLREHLDWLKQKRAEILAASKEKRVAANECVIWGEVYAVRFKTWLGLQLMRSGIDEANRVVSIDAPVNASLRLCIAALQKRLLYREAARILPDWCRRLSIAIPEVSIREMRTRWGSCTPARQTVRLAQGLINLPKDIFEYVLVHELLHFDEPTHNDRFKALLARHMPDYRQKDLLIRSWVPHRKESGQ